MRREKRAELAFENNAALVEVPVSASLDCRCANNTASTAYEGVVSKDESIN
jgi:hypothetical protein